MPRIAATLLCLLTLALSSTARAQSGTVSCDLVQGDLAISSISDTEIDGTLSGDVEGSLVITVDHVAIFPTPFGPVKYIAGHGTLTTADGTLATHDRIVIFPYQGHHYWLGRHLLNNGTGVYADHFGRLRSHGEVNADHTADLHYRGAICTATP